MLSVHSTLRVFQLSLFGLFYAFIRRSSVTKTHHPDANFQRLASFVAGRARGILLRRDVTEALRRFDWLPVTTAATSRRARCTTSRPRGASRPLSARRGRARSARARRTPAAEVGHVVVQHVHCRRAAATRGSPAIDIDSAALDAAAAAAQVAR